MRDEVLLKELVVAFCCNKSPKEVISTLRLLGTGTLTCEAQQLFMQRCYSRESSSLYPPSAEYRRQLLKALTAAAEEDAQELDDLVTDALSGLLLQPRAQRPGWGYKTYFYASSPPRPDAQTVCQAPGTHSAELLSDIDAGDPSTSGSITLRLSPNLLEGSTGCYQWEAAFLLGEYILSNPHLFAGKLDHLHFVARQRTDDLRCMELGCGSGLLGICLQRAGAGHTILTDGNLETLENCKHNLSVNDIPAQAVSVEQLQWGAAEPCNADIILGADIVYDLSVIPQLTSTLKALLQPREARVGGSVAYVAVFPRNPCTVAEFCRSIKAEGLLLNNLSSVARSGKVGFLHWSECERDVLQLYEISRAKRTYG